ncbi:MAG: PspC domain-containing protein [Halanaerobiales bacterium]
MSGKKIYRSREDKMIGGVCGGIAEYFDIDSTIVRLVFLLLLLSPNGFGLLLYIIPWIIIPEKPGDREESYQHKEKDDSIVVDAEVVKDSSNLDFNEDKNENKVKDEIKNQNYTDSRNNQKKHAIIGIALVALGSLFLVDFWMPAFRWERFWPLILIVFGVTLLVKGVKEDE